MLLRWNNTPVKLKKHGLYSQNTMIYKNIFASMLLITAIVCSVQFIQTLEQNRRYKADWVEINHVHYGLLNAGQWTEKIAVILAKKINAFEFTPEKREQTRELIEKALAVLFDEAENKIRERNLQGKQGWDLVAGGLKQLLVENLVGIDKLKKDIPDFADKILLEMEKPENKQKLIATIKQQLQTFSNNTFGEVDLEPYNLILKRYGCLQRLECSQQLSQQMQLQDNQLQQQLWSIIASLLLLIAVLLTDKRRIKVYTMGLLVSACLLLLVLGIVTPMIEIEAKITELEFQLLAEPVNFSEQLVYYQNKSLADVVLLLIKTAKPQVVLVGCLIFLFSIVFPLLKMLCSVIYYYDLKRMQSNTLIGFFALKSGKWSMADVWVVALFMAYMGFDGLVGSQLAELEQASGENLKVLTTNGTELKAGFYLFLSFCLSSLFLSVKIEKNTFGNGKIINSEI